MADQVTNYKCPACTGPMHFSGATGKIECDYCGSSYSVEEVEKMMADANAGAESHQAAADAKEAELKASGEWEFTQEAWTEDGMKAYSCPSCGAELVCDETTAATSCPYCGNPTIVPGQFSGMLKPDYVIPFKLEKKDAVEALTNHYKGKPLLPNSFTADNHIDEVKGVYVPFWLYDGRAMGGVTYDATKVHTERKGDMEITTTEHYKVARAGNIGFEKIPADGSSKMPDDLMDSIEPYDYSDIKDFSKAYLTGFLADKYDVSAEEIAPRVESRAKNTLMDSLDSTVTGYTSRSTVRSHATVKQGKVSYALMPVWLLSTQWNNQNFLFAMNGQSGKMVGDLPIDNGKYWKWVAIVAAILEVLMGLTMLNNGGAQPTVLALAIKFALIPFGIAFIVGGILKGKMKSVHTATSAAKYISGDGLKLTLQKDDYINTTVEKKKIETAGN